MFSKGFRPRIQGPVTTPGWGGRLTVTGEFRSVRKSSSTACAARTTADSERRRRKRETPRLLRVGRRAVELLRFLCAPLKRPRETHCPRITCRAPRPYYYCIPRPGTIDERFWKLFDLTGCHYRVFKRVRHIQSDCTVFFLSPVRLHERFLVLNWFPSFFRRSNTDCNSYVLNSLISS